MTDIDCQVEMCDRMAVYMLSFSSQGEQFSLFFCATDVHTYISVFRKCTDDGVTVHALDSTPPV